MKHKTMRILCLLLSILCLTCTALAAEIYPTIGDLYQHWSTTEMPDWVCSVSSTDGTGSNLTVLVNSQAAADELAGMVEDESGLEIIVADGVYSHNELLHVQNEIAQKYMGPDGPVVSVGTGWALIDGEVTGFGESGRESRVVVGILPEYVEEYGKLLEKQYGDKVYVENSGRVLLETSMGTATEDSSSAPVGIAPWVYPVAAAIIVAGALVIWLLRKKTAAK